MREETTTRKREISAASPGVLVWMAKILLAQNSIDDAIAAMNRLLEVYSETGGEFLFDANFILDKQMKRRMIIKLRLRLSKCVNQFLLA